MNIPKSDFEGMKYNVTVVKHGTDMLLTFPELQTLKSFVEYKNADKNRAIRYIILMYSKDSPMRDRYPDVKRRKEACALMAGYEQNPKKTGFKEKIDYLFSFEGVKGGQVLEMVAEFLMHKKDRLMSKISSTEQAFWEYQKLIFDPIKNGTDDKDKDVLSAATTKTKLIVDSDDLDERLKGYYSELVNGNDEIVEEVKKKGLAFTPEGFAKSNAA